MTDASSKARSELLVQLEQIIGNKCYNGNIQNWGPGGSYMGEGRHFRYPLSYYNDQGGRSKVYGSARNLSDEQLRGAFYAFGANRLSIMRALDEVLIFLEKNNDLMIEKPDHE